MSMSTLDAGTFDDGLTEKITGLDASGRFYPVGKLDAHLSSIPHLAISVFLMHDEKLLLQRRAVGKYHSPLLWANTACSHPLWGETPETCVERTLHRELGIAVPTRQFGLTRYQSRVGELFENETVFCFRGELDPADLPPPNGDEVDSLRWASLNEIGEELALYPEIFAPWFAIYVRTGLLNPLLLPAQ